MSGCSNRIRRTGGPDSVARVLPPTCGGRPCGAPNVSFLVGRGGGRRAWLPSRLLSMCYAGFVSGMACQKMLPVGGKARERRPFGDLWEQNHGKGQSQLSQAGTDGRAVPDPLAPALKQVQGAWPYPNDLTFWGGSGSGVVPGAMCVWTGWITFAKR